jgi:hypothetical protein
VLTLTINQSRNAFVRTNGYQQLPASSLLYQKLKMGAGQSTGSHPQTPPRALHVLRVTPSSPASQANVEPFFDFVVGLEGDTHSSRKALDAAELEAIVEKNEGKVLSLLVWNSKSQTTRGMCEGISMSQGIDPLTTIVVVKITPSRTWSQQGLPPNAPKDAAAGTQPSLLGLSMRICEPEFALENVWHVMDVLEGSPAESAGLVPYGDWIIGWSGGVLGAEGDFYDVVEAVRVLLLDVSGYLLTLLEAY